MASSEASSAAIAVARTTHGAGQERLAARKSLDVDVADSLREAILSGTLKPGERITELGLADQWQVSQGTVRAALKILQGEGLVQSIPRRGTTVTAITEADLYEIYTLRDALEGVAAERAAARVTPGAKRALTAILEEMRKAAEAGDRRGMLDLDFRFHRTIVDMCDHARLSAVYSNLESQTRLFLTMTDLLHHALDETVTIHAELAGAILAGEVARAYQLARRHSERDAKELAAALFPPKET